MKALMIRRLVALTASGLAMLALPAAAQLSTTAPGPYYATPSWGQKLTTSRFVILANWNSEAVLDRETGLLWERSPDTTTRTWNGAMAHCINRTVGGRKGWRLPGIQELLSPLDPAVVAPPLPAGHPFINVISSEYWSATANIGDSGSQWAVVFFNAFAFASSKLNEHFVWCVRGGQGAAAQ